MNNAQKLLVGIGGMAELVAGHMGHYYADSSTAKKTKQRAGSRVGRAVYGENLKAHFDSKVINWSTKKNGIKIRQNRMWF